MPRMSKRQDQLEEAWGSKRKEPQREEELDGLSSPPGPSTSSQLVTLEMLPSRSKRLKHTAISRDQENSDDGNGR